VKARAVYLVYLVVVLGGLAYFLVIGGLGR
jgi:hypothetical protein